jgi:hypothetical protein
VKRGLWLGSCLVALATSAPAGPPEIGRVLADADGQQRVLLFVDRDDDDDDGIQDSKQARLKTAAESDLLFVEPKGGARKLEAIEGDAVRVLVSGKPVEPKTLIGKKLTRLALQGVHAGTTKVKFEKLTLELVVVDVLALDKNGEPVDLARSHASVSRVLPATLVEPGSAGDPDALRWLVAGPAGSLPGELEVASASPDGTVLDTLPDVLLTTVTCPSHVGTGLFCKQTPLLRATGDIVDRSHPDSSKDSLVAEVGGRLLVGFDHSMTSLRVGGPRHSALGPMDRYRGRLRVRLVRLAAGGAPPVGGDDAGALAVGRREVNVASGLWGQCGVHFGQPKDLDIQIVDPPAPHLLAVGCDFGTPASGGLLSVRAGKHVVRVQTKAGQTPTEVAHQLVLALEKVGLRASVSPNALISPGALRSVDVLVREPNGSVPLLATEENLPLSSDPTLDVCLGEVDLADGLDHFTDFDAVAGTVEERSLVKAFDDGDPTTIEVFVIPNFAHSGRIGESFIYADGSSMRNVVIIDRAAVRAGARSFALAHELGHILLDMPGHPDDYGVDQPSTLMDADAADPTIFGPRRLSVEDCERALRQSGPSAPVPLLSSWPLHRGK